MLVLVRVAGAVGVASIDPAAALYADAGVAVAIALFAPAVA